MAEQNGVSAKLWLALLKEGGRHSATEVATLIEESNSAGVHQLLASLVATRSLRKFEKLPGGRVQFGVTAACRVPRGVTIADVLACDLQGSGKA